MDHIVYVQAGMGNMNRRIAEEYADIGKEASAAGVLRAQYAQIWSQNLQRGFVQTSRINKMLESTLKKEGKQLRLDQKQMRVRDAQINSMKSVTTTALATAQQLNMDMEATNEVFMDWHMQLGLSAASMGSMGRHMREVAKQSGIMGKNMDKAMQRATDIAKKMKASGTFTPQAGRLVTELMAGAEQLGIGEKVGELVLAQSSYHEMMEADDKLRSFITRSAQAYRDAQGQIDPLMTHKAFFGGLLQSIPDAKKQMQGMQNYVKDMLFDTQAFADAGLNVGEAGLSAMFKAVGIDRENFDLSHATSEIQRFYDHAKVLEAEMEEARKKGHFAEADRLEAQSKRYMTMYGVLPHIFEKGHNIALGDLERTNQLMEKTYRTSYEKINDLERKKQALVKEGLEGGSAHRDLAAQKIEAESSAYLTMFETLEHQMAANKGMGMDDRVAANMMTYVKENMGAAYLPTTGKVDYLDFSSKMFDKFRERAANIEGFDIDEWLESEGDSAEKLSKALASGNEEALKGALKTVDLLQQEMAKRERTGQNAMTDLRQAIMDLTRALEGYTAQFLKWFRDSPLIVKMTFVLSMVAAGLSGLGAALWGLAKFIPGFRNLVPTMGQVLGRKTPTALTSTSQYLGRTGAVVGDDVAKAGGIFGLKALGKLLGGVGILASGIFGGREAEKAGKSFAEGAGFGVLTGGGTSQSLLGGLFGAKKGGKADTALALGESAIYGGLTGALIGSFFGPVGTLVGAAIGAVVAPLIKGVQMLGEKFQWVADVAGTIINPIGHILGGIWEAIKGWGNIIAGIFTLDADRIKKGIWQVATGFLVGLAKAIGSLIVGLVKSVGWAFVGIGKLIWMGLKNIFISTPKLFMDGLRSLANSEWFGPIFKPILATAEAIGELFKPVQEFFIGMGILFNEWWSKVGPEFGKAIDWIKGIKPYLDPVINFMNKLNGIFAKFVIFGVLVPTLKNFIAIVGTLIGSVFYPLAGMFKMIGATIKGFIGVLAGIGDVLIGLFTFDFSRMGKGFRKIGESIWEALKKVFWTIPGEIRDNLGTMVTDAFWSIVDGIVAPFKWLYKVLVGESIIPDLINEVIKWFRFLMAPFKMFWEGLKKLGGILRALKGAWTGGVWDGLKNIGTWLYDNITGALGGFGSWVWSEIKNAGKNAVTNLITGEDEVQKVRDALDPNQAKRISGLANKEERIKAAASQGLDAEIKQLKIELALAQQSHKKAKESVVQWEAKEKATKSWWSDALNPKHRAAIASKQDAILDRQTQSGAIYGLQERLKAAQTSAETLSQEKALNRQAIPQNLGAFERGGAAEAMRGGMPTLPAYMATPLGKEMGERVRKMQATQTGALKSTLIAPPGETEKLEKATQSYMEMLRSSKIVAEAGTGLHYGDTPGNSATDVETRLAKNEKNVVDQLSKIEQIRSRTSDKDKSIVAELSRALYYETDRVTKTETGILAERGDVSSGDMDYSDTIKPMIEPLLTSRTSVEERIERQRAGEQSDAGSSMLPSMDEISDYLSIIQSKKLDEMIGVLETIRDQMGSGTESSPIGAGARGVPSSARPGIKSIAHDLTRGKWDLTFGDNAAGVVTTEGRGGSG
jgi:hypothetical protein